MDVSSHNWTTLPPPPNTVILVFFGIKHMPFLLEILCYLCGCISISFHQRATDKFNILVSFFFSYFTEAQVNEMSLICLLPTITGIWYFVPFFPSPAKSACYGVVPSREGFGVTLADRFLICFCSWMKQWSSCLSLTESTTFSVQLRSLAFIWSGYLVREWQFNFQCKSSALWEAEHMLCVSMIH